MRLTGWQTTLVALSRSHSRKTDYSSSAMLILVRSSEVAIGCLLIIAAALKVHALHDTVERGDYALPTRIAQGVLVIYEAILGVFVMAYGLRIPQVRRVVLLTFAAFACVSAYSAAAGRISCGCFGPLELSPWHALLLDLAVCLWILLVSLDSPRSLCSPKILRPLHGAYVTTVFAALLASAACGALARPRLLEPDGSTVGSANSIAFSPLTWVGHEFPLLPWMIDGPDLREGTWVILFHRRGCPQCESVRAEYERAVAATASSVRTFQIALIDVAAGKDHTRAFTHIDGMVECRLDTSRRWIIDTPSAVILRNGVVHLVARHAEDPLSLIVGTRRPHGEMNYPN